VQFQLSRNQIKHVEDGIEILPSPNYRLLPGVLRFLGIGSQAAQFERLRVDSAEKRPSDGTGSGTPTIGEEEFDTG